MGCAQSSIPTRDIDNNKSINNTTKSPRLVSAVASPAGSPSRKTVRINTSANTTTTFEKTSFCTYKPTELMFELYLDSKIETEEDNNIKCIIVQPKNDVEEEAPITIAPVAVSDDEEEENIISNNNIVVNNIIKKSTSRSQSRDSNKSNSDVATSTPGATSNNSMTDAAVVEQQDNTIRAITATIVAAEATPTAPLVEEEKDEEENNNYNNQEDNNNTNQEEAKEEEEPEGAVAPRLSNGRRVVFDKETLARTAPITIANNNTINNKTNKGGKKTKLTRKQKELLRKGQVSTGRYGPVTSKGCRSKGQMQTDVYLEMAAAFERLLTNASTINAHLDTN